jgi:predicted PurR-regulated permease PerM
MKQLLSQRLFFQHAAACLLFFVLLGFVLQYAASVFIPLAFSFLLSFIVLPLSCKLEKCYFPRWLSAAFGILVAVFIVGSVLTLLGYQLSSLLNDLPVFKARLNEKILEVQQYIRINWGLTIKEQNTWLSKQMESSSDSTSAYIMSFFGTTTSFIVNALLVPILAFFLLAYRSRFKKFLELADEKYHQHTILIIEEISKVSQSYLKGVMFDTVILAILNFIGFSYFGLQYALLFAVLAAVLNIIPYIGGLVGSIIPVFMALVTLDNTWSAMGILGVGLFVQFLDNNFIGPKVIGSSVSVNPLFSTLALLIGALLWGISGMLLAMPFAGMLKVFFDNVPTLQPYGYLIGEEDKYKVKTFAINPRFMPYLRSLLDAKK